MPLGTSKVLGHQGALGVDRGCRGVGAIRGVGVSGVYWGWQGV